MASSTKHVDSFVYFIPVPSISRNIALAAAAFFLCGFLYIPLRIGADRTFESLKDDPLLWLILFGMLVLPIAFFLVLAFPPANWRPRLEIRHDYIRFVPMAFARWLGDPSPEVQLTQWASEIILCRGSQDFRTDAWGNRVDFPYGLRLVARSEDGHDRDLKVATGDRLSAHQVRVLIDGITSATGLPVRLIKRETGSDGTVHEAHWSPAGTNQFGVLGMMAFAATPYVGGIVVGYLRAEPVIVAAVGIALWLTQTIALFAYAHFSHQKQSGVVKVYWLSTVFSFTAIYLVSFAVVYYVFGSH